MSPGQSQKTTSPSKHFLSVSPCWNYKCFVVKRKYENLKNPSSQYHIPTSLPHEYGDLHLSWSHYWINHLIRNRNKYTKNNVNRIFNEKVNRTVRLILILDIVYIWRPLFCRAQIQVNGLYCNVLLFLFNISPSAMKSSMLFKTRVKPYKNEDGVLNALLVAPLNNIGHLILFFKSIGLSRI